MSEYDATEIAYRNGFSKGYEKGFNAGIKVAEKHRGKWILFGNEDDMGMSYECSICRWQTDEDTFYDKFDKFVPYKRCPECGAIMDVK